MPAQTRLNLPVGTDPASVRQRVEAMERLLERLVVIPGIRREVGLDAMLDLIPVVGDIAAAALGAYIVREARNLSMHKWKIARMTGNVGINWLLGLASVVPVIGVIPTLLLRSNSYNLRMIKKHLDKHHPETAIVDARATRSQKPPVTDQTCTPSISSSTGRPRESVSWRKRKRSMISRHVKASSCGTPLERVTRQRVTRPS